MKIMKNLVLVLMVSVGVTSFDLHAAAAGRRFLNNAFHVVKPAVTNSLYHWTRKTLQQDRQYTHVPNNFAAWHDVKVINASGKYIPRAPKVEGNQGRPLVALSPKSDKVLEAIAIGQFAIYTAMIIGGIWSERHTAKLLQQEEMRQKDERKKAAEKQYNNRHNLIKYGVLSLFDSLEKEFPESCIVWIGDDLESLSNACCKQTIKSIILLVHSGGGSFDKSIEIEKYIKLLKKEHGNIPCIEYVPRIASSGAYKIGCVSDKIIVEPLACVGSIGTIRSWCSNFATTNAVVLTQEEKKCSNFKVRSGIYKCKLDNCTVDYAEMLQRIQQMSDEFVNERNAVKEDLDELNNNQKTFIDNVQAGCLKRGCQLPDDATLWAEGRMFGNYPGKLNPESDTLEKALEYGLIDRIVRPGENYVDVIREELARLHEQRKKLIRSL